MRGIRDSKAEKAGNVRFFSTTNLLVSLPTTQGLCLMYGFVKKWGYPTESNSWSSLSPWKCPHIGAYPLLSQAIPILCSHWFHTASACSVARCKHTRIAWYCRFSWSCMALPSFLRSPNPAWPVIPREFMWDPQCQEPSPIINLLVVILGGDNKKMWKIIPRIRVYTISTTTIGAGFLDPPVKLDPRMSRISSQSRWFSHPQEQGLSKATQVIPLSLYSSARKCQISPRLPSHPSKTFHETSKLSRKLPNMS